MATEKRRPSPPYVRLASIADCRAEMGRVYRLANAGEIWWGEATKRIHCLAQIARLIELEAEEARRQRNEADCREMMVTYGLAAPNGSDRR